MAEAGAGKQNVFSRIDQALNYDFCPWANQWVYWLKHPLVGMVVVALAAGICGLYVAAQAWLLFGGLMFVGLLGLIWPLIAITGITATVRFEQAWCEEGTATRIRVSVRNWLPCPVWGLSLSGGVPGEKLLVSFTRVAGWKTTEFLWEFVPRQRGIYPDRPILVETGFPFGVWTARKPAEVEGEFVVLPKPVELDAVPEIGEGISFDEVYSDRKTGDAGDVTGTRPFRAGDSLRRVHWALTARTSRLICCERQAVLHSAVLVTLDAESSHHSTPGPDSSLEWAIRMFAGICREFSNQGIRVSAAIGPDIVPVQAGHQGMLRLLQRLARLPQQGLPAGKTVRTSSAIAGVSVATNRSQPVQAKVQVLLNAEEFEPDHEKKTASMALEPATAAAKQQIFVSGADEAKAAFRQSWRRVCRAVS